MRPKDFCEHHGFSLEVEEVSHDRNLVHVIDRNKRIFESGKREGRILISSKSLEWTVAKAYSELMDLILDTIYK